MSAAAEEAVLEGIGRNGGIWGEEGVGGEGGVETHVLAIHRIAMNAIKKCAMTGDISGWSLALRIVRRGFRSMHTYTSTYKHTRGHTQACMDKVTQVGATSCCHHNKQLHYYTCSDIIIISYTSREIAGWSYGHAYGIQRLLASPAI